MIPELVLMGALMAPAQADIWRTAVEWELRNPKIAQESSPEAIAWRNSMHAFIREMNRVINDLNAGKLNAKAWKKAQKLFHELSDPKYCKGPKAKKEKHDE